MDKVKDDGALAAEFDLMVQEVTALSEDYGDEVQEAVRSARETPLDPVQAQRLWTKLLTRLRSAGRDLDEDERARLAEEVRKEVADVVDSVTRPDDDTGIRLRAHGGLQPHLVRPIPTFNGQPIPLSEGYVDVDDLDLWSENHRVELHVEEFRERNDRNPEPHELLLLLQGEVELPSLGKADPFTIKPLAKSIARKGVERPPIVTHEGVPKDGNRRIAAAKYVVSHPDAFTADERERARWIRVWKAPKETTADEFEAIVVALNFEPDYKEPWPEYVKARLVAREYEKLRETTAGRFSQAKERDLKRDVASQFSIETREVTRYLKMVRWAEDFEEYHVGEGGRNPAEVRYKTNDIFQWFYEIDAGTGNVKLTRRLDQDDELKAVVYDLMFDVLDSGAQVRSLYKVVADDEATKMLLEAHGVSDADPDDALSLVKEAVEEAKRNNVARRRIDFDQWVRTAVQRLGRAAPDEWKSVDTEMLKELRRVLHAALGTIGAELEARDEPMEVDT